MLRLGDRVIQIPLDWPSRQGTVISLDVPGHQVCVAWTDGRKSWIHEADFVREGIWLVAPDVKITLEPPAVAPV
jgi:hypothetical protein